MNKIPLLLITSILTIHLYGQDSTAIDKTGYRKGNQQDFRSLVREGNRQYNLKKAADAERSYRKALDVDEKSNLATFNLGNAMYRQQKFEEAGKEFEKAASAATDKTDKALAYHNLGNSYLQQQKLKESIEAYKQALRNNPNDLETKYNLSFALNLLKEQEQQQNQDNQDNKDKQDQQNKDQQNQDNQDQQNQDQQQQDQQKDEQQQQQQQISREDAQRILEAIAQEEKELQEKLQKKEPVRSRQIEKNW
jgi:tetratricopeptide (TPR) repeat protein